MVEPLPKFEHRPFWAEIEGAGLVWNVYFRNGLVQYGPSGEAFWWFGSRKHVTRKAQRMLARLNNSTKPERFIIRDRET